MMDDLTTSLVIFVLCALIALALALQRLRRTGWNVIDPVATFGIGFAAYYGISNAWYCVALMTDQMDRSEGWEFDPQSTGGETLILAVAVMTAAFGSSFVLGARLVSPFRQRNLTCGLTHPKPEKSSYRQAILVLAPLAVWGWATSFGVIPSLNGIAPTPIVMLPKIGVLGLLLTLCHQAATRPGPAHVLIAVAAVGWSFAQAMTSAMKEEVISPLLAALAGVVMATRSWRPIAASAILGIPVVLALNLWVMMNREGMSAVNDLPPGMRLEHALTVGLSDGLSVETLTLSTENFMRRLCTLIPMAETLLMIDRNESISMIDGLVVPLTPRVFWPDKPSIDIGGRLYQSFSGLYGSSNSPNLPAETFMYGGWLGILMGGLALGVSAELLSLIGNDFWERRIFFGVSVMIPFALLYGKCESWLHQYAVLSIALVPLLAATSMVFSHGKRRPKRGSVKHGAGGTCPADG